MYKIKIQTCTINAFLTHLPVYFTGERIHETKRKWFSFQIDENHSAIQKLLYLMKAYFEHTL